MTTGCNVSLSIRKTYDTGIFPRRERQVLQSIRSPLKATTKGWAGPSILILLFVVSAAYVIFGGAFELKAPPAPKAHTSMTVVALEPANASGSTRIEKVSGHSAGNTK
jgi:hypothetical protein